MFVYDPIFLEGPGQSYILEWAQTSVNQSTVESITRGGEKPHPVFHMFTFPKVWRVVDLLLVILNF